MSGQNFGQQEGPTFGLHEQVQSVCEVGGGTGVCPPTPSEKSQVSDMGPLKMKLVLGPIASRGRSIWPAVKYAEG